MMAEFWRRKNMLQRADSNRQPQGHEPYGLPIVPRCITECIIITVINSSLHASIRQFPQAGFLSIRNKGAIMPQLTPLVYKSCNIYTSISILPHLSHHPRNDQNLNGCQKHDSTRIRTWVLWFKAICNNHYTMESLRRYPVSAKP